MSNEIRRKPEMTKANPYNDIKLSFGVIISLLKKYKFKYGRICATTKV